MLSIYVTDDLRLEEYASGSKLRITSEFHPRGMMGKLVSRMFGGYLRRLMVDEWESADRAFRSEVRSKEQKLSSKR